MQTLGHLKMVLAVLAVSLFMLPEALFAGTVFWNGAGSNNSWTNVANWAGNTLPSASDDAWVPNRYSGAPIMPLIDARAGAVTIRSLEVGTYGYDGSVIQTGGAVTCSGEVGVGGDVGRRGTYTISGGSLNAGAHILITDSATSSGLFEVDGSGATSITASYQLYFRGGAGELKYVLDAAGVTPITAARLIVGTGVSRTLTVDASAYTGPTADIVLVNYSATGYWDGHTFSTINLSGGAQSIAYGTVIPNKLTVHVVPSPFAPTTTTLARHSGTGTQSNYGDPLSFDVAVTPGASTGTVTLKNGGTSGITFGSGTLSSGACTITTTALGAGTHANIVAVYGGDSTHAPSTSAALSPAQTVTNISAANIVWVGTGTNALWSNGANWDLGIAPTPYTGNVRIGDNGGTITNMPNVAAGTNICAGYCYVGDNGPGNGPGSLTVRGGTLQVGAGLAIGFDYANGAVTQTGGAISAGEIGCGGQANFGSHKISGGSISVSHILLSDSAVSSGLFEVDGSGATSILATYQLYFRNGAGELKFVLDGPGVTPITAARFIVGTGASRTLTVDASAYAGPAADIVLVDYSATGYWDGNTFSTINLLGGAQSLAYGTVIANKLSVHVVPSGTDHTPPTPNPATFAMYPYAIGASAITMVATTGIDPSGPVQYYFAETSGHPGGSDSGWQTSPSYTDTGLSPSTQYSYTVKMGDSLGNTGTASLAISATTQPGSGVGPRSVWNQRVDPKIHPGALARKIMPVTWEDQGGLVLLPVATGLNLTADYNGVNMPAYRGYLDYWTSGLLNSTNAPFGFESQLYPDGGFAYTTNYNQVIDEWVNRDSYIAGFTGPGGWTYDGFFSVLNTNFPGGIPDAVHNYAMTQFGGRFGGWQYAENDAGYCYSPMPEEPPTREIGHDLFLGFNHRWSEKLHNYMVSMQNTTWGPYMADTSYFRMLGVQTPNQMYNINMWAGLLRGASRQNGVLWWPNIDSFWLLN